MQCASVYPCPEDQAGLNILTAMQERYGCEVGFSDHTMSSVAAICAVALGARVIEKHFTLSRDLYGSDASHSLEPAAFRTFTADIRKAVQAVGTVIDKDAMAARLVDMKVIFEKSVVAARDIRPGEEISLEMLAFKKPGDGIKASRYRQVAGKTARVMIPADTKITEGMLE